MHPHTRNWKSPGKKGSSFSPPIRREKCLVTCTNHMLMSKTWIVCIIPFFGLITVKYLYCPWNIHVLVCSHQKLATGTKLVDKEHINQRVGNIQESQGWAFAVSHRVTSICSVDERDLKDLVPTMATVSVILLFSSVKCHLAMSAAHRSQPVHMHQRHYVSPQPCHCKHTHVNFTLTSWT